MQTLSEAELYMAPFFLDLLENDTLAKCQSFFQHMGFDFGRLPENCTSKQLLAALTDHYTDKEGEFDEEGLPSDMETWPPIANRIAELRREQAAKSKSEPKRKRPRARKASDKANGAAHA